MTYLLISILAVSFGAALLVFFLRKKARAQLPAATPLTVGLAPTHSRLGARLGALFTRGAVDSAFLAEIEETLISADVGMATVQTLMSAVRDADTPVHARELLRECMISLFTAPVPAHSITPRVILVMGVNGVGKTTSIAKLAHRFQREGARVILAAADTFRAAAVEQLQVWGGRLKCEVVAQAMGADAASVAFDAVTKAVAKGYEVVLIDTAGRLHTKHNLMEELKKIERVIAKALPGAPHERWLVMDATVGQNGLAQAREFHAAIGLTGVIVTKLDGTAKGGIVCSVTELGIPVISIGVGEGMEDLRPFEPIAFVDAILN